MANKSKTLRICHFHVTNFTSMSASTVATMDNPPAGFVVV